MESEHEREGQKERGEKEEDGKGIHGHSRGVPWLFFQSIQGPAAKATEVNQPVADIVPLADRLDRGKLFKGGANNRAVFMLFKFGQGEDAPPNLVQAPKREGQKTDTEQPNRIEENGVDHFRKRR
ncbi:MAG: hypothetical protein LBD10_00815 [Desulfobulbus sp.]|jgi:antitoxin (DNA-binding transcriptional repressor) of toxin-antitoxin stability system|uniref:hypothetical protein n=1 Tax=Desulfobulbus sp. TaxID=895 RepID=UPI0028405CF8|nr:hypothetical protein [Desulfobulbus sp.]MDR2548741.1 hypothetical protein [Desulfobulbus sp.]